MRSFLELADGFIPDGMFYRTHFSYNVVGQSLKLYKVLLVEGSTIVNVEHVRSRYTRTTVYVLPLTFEFKGKDINTISMKIKPNILQVLNKTSVLNFTVNQPAIVETEKILYLEGPAEDVHDLVKDFKTFVDKLTDDDIKEELFAANIDVPEFGVSGDRLFIINKHDKIISRMMMFGKFTWRNKEYDSLSIYYFDENLFQMKENILSKYVLIFNGAIQTNVNVDQNYGMKINNDTVIAVPLKNTKYRDYNMGEVRKLFGRKSILKI